MYKCVHTQQVVFYWLITPDISPGRPVLTITFSHCFLFFLFLTPISISQESRCHFVGLPGPRVRLVTSVDENVHEKTCSHTHTHTHTHIHIHIHTHTHLRGEQSFCSQHYFCTLHTGTDKLQNTVNSFGISLSCQQTQTQFLLGCEVLCSYTILLLFVPVASVMY